MHQGLELKEFMKMYLDTPMEVFGNKSAIQFAETAGWEAVFATFSRVSQTVYGEADINGLKKMVIKLLENDTENALTLKLDEGIFLKMQAQLKVTTDALKDMLNANIDSVESYNDFANDVHKKFMEKMGEIGDVK